jgi:hypothetical protein
MLASVYATPVPVVVKLGFCGLSVPTATGHRGGQQHGRQVGRVADEGGGGGMMLGRVL